MHMGGGGYMHNDYLKLSNFTHFDKAFKTLPELPRMGRGWGGGESIFTLKCELFILDTRRKTTNVLISPIC